jgi:uncharacterized protein YbjT (DUF2867 family)
MQHNILVTGGTGTLGRHLVPRLQATDSKIRILSRSNNHEAGKGIEFVSGDLATGEGIEAAVQGVETIIHCAGSSKGDEEKTRNLVRAASQAGVRHIVYISVVGADRVPVKSGIDRAMFGYFASKLASERVIIESGLPWTILRATQFHDLLFMVAQMMAKLPIVPAFAGFHYQPVDADDVAARLTQLASGKPAGLVSDLGGPRVYTMVEILRSYLRANHQHRLIIPIWQPGQAARAHRAGANLTPDHADGTRTWEDFLAERLG